MTISMLAAAYLFFGGAGAGTFFFAALADLPFYRRAMDGAAITRAYGVALVLLAAGILCLVFDLGRPNQALLVFLHPTLSFLTVGAYLLAALMVITPALLLAKAFSSRGGASFPAVAAKAAGALIALGVMVYTGLLLRGLHPIPLWSSALLPAFFLVSSLAAGLACAFLCTHPMDALGAAGRVAERRFARTDVTLVAAEALIAALYVASLATGIGTEVAPSAGAASTAAASLTALTQGLPGALFLGGFGVLALLAPAAADIAVLCRAVSATTSAIAAVLAVAGCFCLRAGLVLAGIHVGV